jgi:hypothetical protein
MKIHFSQSLINHDTGTTCLQMSLLRFPRPFSINQKHQPHHR